MCVLCEAAGIEIDDCERCGTEFVPVYLDGSGCAACVDKPDVEVLRDQAGRVVGVVTDPAD